MLEWYSINFQPIAAPPKREAIEILGQLKKLHFENLRPEIRSVRFVQGSDKCYIEMTTGPLNDNYDDETIRREDLGFIVSDHETDESMFDPDKSIQENANTFINEMDEISIINCTDLFVDDWAPRNT